MANECGRERFTVGPAPDSASAFATFRVNPGYSVDYQQCAHLVTHCAAALDDSALEPDPSFSLTPRHR